MSTGQLSEVAAMIDGRLSGTDRSFVGVSTDTRSLQSGELYVALRGPNFDGHEFVERAQQLGAAGALVAERVDVDLPQIVTDDTRTALARYASAWRARFAIDVVAVTGSNGKTSVKEMLAAMLGKRGDTLATRGNYNNDIGVPLTLLRLQRSHRAAVIEVGASAGGEVAALAALAAPQVGIVNNAARAHLEGFGSVEAVARAKGEMFSALPEDGVAIINADDAYFDYWKGVAGARSIITFGETADADVTFTDFEQHVHEGSARIEFNVHARGSTQRFVIPAAGRHNARNALAATAACLAFGMTLADCARGLEAVDMASGRLQVLTTPGGARVIDDSYNANPASVRAAIEFLSEQNESGWLVLGDMGELGDDEREMHAQVGKYAREHGLRRLYGVGDLTRAAVTAFGDGGRWFEHVESLIAALLADARGDINVLVKASRSMRLERVVQAMRDAPVDQLAEG
ncbi:MAG: UDP-N-acetylmuramoyl-tripeptide--D-alanyl-D-alanine ligase [Gammaproteobacteria bacterium]